jgi:phosphoribosylglycinamide formyltransferase-1
MYTLVILISGNGSNLQAIIDAIAQHQWPIKIALVLSDRQNALGLERAKKVGIQTIVLDPSEFISREAYDVALQATVDKYFPDLVVLAGFMRILGKAFVQYFQGRLINIHPSLLPRYKGLNTHKKVLAAQEKEHGVTIHLVTEDLDGGPILAQAKLMINPQDTEDSLKQRVHHLEHILYPEVIHWFSVGKLVCTKEGVFFEGKKMPENGIYISQPY